jgi:tetratricopeptide (TPR) repeat protein
VQVWRGQLLEALDPRNAVPAYAVALNAASLEGHAAAGLERLLEVPSARAAAAQALEPFARLKGDPGKLAEVLDALERPTVERLVEIAALRQKAGQVRLALGAMLGAFALDPKNHELRNALERMAEQQDAAEELLSAYEGLVDRDPKLGDALLLRRIAELHDALGHRDQAFEAWEYAAEAAPHDAELLRAYAEKCRARGDLARLARVLRWQISATKDLQTRLKLTAQLANLCDDSLADYAGAAQAYQELLAHAPNDLALLKTLERLYAQTQNNSELMRVLDKRIVLARESSPVEVVPLALKLARMLLEPPVQGERAHVLLREVLEGWLVYTSPSPRDA